MSILRRKFAKVGATIYLRKLLIPFIEFLGHLQTIEYEALHIICFGCHGYKDKKESCPRLVRTEKIVTTVVEGSGQCPYHE